MIDHEKIYKNNIKNAKAVKKILEKSGLNPTYLKKINWILENYTLEIEKTQWLYEFCRDHWVYGMDYISKPQKITAFTKPYLEIVKKRLENWVDDYLHEYWKFDYTIHTSVDEYWNPVGRYSREYKGCGNWYYSILLNYDTHLFIEKD